MTDMPYASVRDLARRLLIAEAAVQSATQPLSHEGVRVCRTLQVALTRFAGTDGFASLMRRSLVLARVEVPSMHGIKIKVDGSIEGLEELAADSRDSGGDLGTEAAVAITTHLLGLLVTFVGERITLRLMCEAWPGAPLNESDERNKAP